MSIANYTTGMAPDRSAAAITKDLVKAGARGIASEYDNAGRLVGLSFAIQIDGEVFHYTLPVRVDAVFDVLKADRLPPKQKTREHAERVAWAIMRDWVRAQTAIIETEMVSLRQIFLPYLKVSDNQTVFDRWENQRLQIESGNR